MSFSMSCFFLFTMLLSCAVARGCENACCLALVHIPFYFAMLFASLFIPNGAIAGKSGTLCVSVQAPMRVDWEPTVAV